MRILIFCLIFSGLAAGHTMQAQSAWWGKGKEQLKRGVLGTFQGKTIFYEWRSLLSDEHSKMTLVMLRTDTAAVRTSFYILPKTLTPSVTIPGFLQVLYCERGGPGPFDKKVNASGFVYKWSDYPSDSVTFKTTDEWKMLPGGTFARIASTKVQLFERSNTGNMRDTVAVSVFRFYPSGNTETRSTRSKIYPSGDSLRPVTEVKTIRWSESGKVLTESTRHTTAQYDSLRITGTWPNGVSASSSLYVNGQLEGQFQRWNADGDEVCSGKYLQGHRTGLWKISRPDGSPFAELDYSDGTEKWMTVWMDGKKVVQDGKGEWHRTQTTPDGCTVSLTTSYKAGKPTGTGGRLRSCETVSSFPGAEYSYIRAWLKSPASSENDDPEYNSFFKTFLPEPENPAAPLAEGWLSPGYHHGNFIQLSKAQATALADAMSKPESFSASGASCEERNWLLVAYDSDHQPVGWLEAGLKCESVRIWPPVPGSATGRALSVEGYTALSRLCRALYNGLENFDPLGKLPAESVPAPAAK